MTPADLADAIVVAVRGVVADAGIDVPLPAAVPVERPSVRGHGDYVTPVALQLAGVAHRPARELAEALAVRLCADAGVASVDVAGPGFLDIHLTREALGEIARTVVRAGADYGWASTAGRVRADLGGDGPGGESRGGPDGEGGPGGRDGGGVGVVVVAGTGPAGGTSVAAARRVIVAGVLGRLFDAAGLDAATSDAATSDAAGLDAVGFEGAAGCYGGGAVTVLAGATVEPTGVVGGRSVASTRAGQPAGSADPTQSSDLAESVDLAEAAVGSVDSVMRPEQPGAVLTRGKVPAGDLGESTLSVLSDASPRGRAAAHVARGKVAVPCGGAITVLAPCAYFPLRPLVAAPAAHVAFGDLVDAVGADAARYALVRTRLDAPLDLDVAHLARQTTENPAFRVRYAHARICLLKRSAAALGVALDPDGADVALLSHPREAELLRAVGDLPRVVASAARLRAPCRLARYLEELAGTYDRFHDTCRVLPRGDEEPSATFAARLLLAEATRLVLANGLRLLGVGAPERM